MVISHKHRFIFLKTLKTAGTSIEVFLSGVCDERDVVTPIYPPVPPHAARNYQGLFNPLRGRSAREIASNCFDCVRLRKFYNHIRCYRLRDRLPPRLWDGYFKFCVERNPWDKTLSFFYMLKNRDWHVHRNPDGQISAQLSNLHRAVTARALSSTACCGTSIWIRISMQCSGFSASTGRDA
jgi:hypothetical protein